MNVYIIEVGNVDTENEVLVSIWETEEAAINAARATANEIVADLNQDFIENGYSTYECRCDDGAYLITIKAPGFEIDWWRISKRHVLHTGGLQV